MPGSSRYACEILSTVRETFKQVRVEVFENPLTFESMQPFLDYTRASLSEDRKLWRSFFQDKKDFEKLWVRSVKLPPNAWKKKVNW